MLERVRKKGNPPILLVRMKVGAAMWEKVFLRKLRIGLPHDPAIPLLGYYPDETIIQKVTCTLTCIAAIFTITKTRK